MKNNTLLLTFLMSFIFYLSYSQIRIVKVDTNNGEVTIKNFGTTTNISSYRFCARFNYTNSGDFNSLLVSGNLNLVNNAEVILDWNTITGAPFPAGSDLGLYLPTGGFGSGANMVDFVQWGSNGNGRESVADGINIWTAGDFISNDGSAYIYTGNGTQNGNSFWTTETILSVNSNQFAREIKIHPNPTKNEFSISSNTIIDSIRIISLTGQVIKKFNFNLERINTSDLTSGLYLIEFTAKDKKGIKRLIIL